MAPPPPEQRLEVARPRRGRRVLSEHDFRSRVESERARVRRYGNESTLVVFSVPARLDAERFAEGILHALRGADSAGWASRRELGVLFSGTAGAKAERAVERLRDRAGYDDIRTVSYRSMPIEPTAEFFRPKEPLRRESRRPVAPRPSSGARVVCDGRGPAVLLSRELPPSKRAFDILAAGTGLLVLSPLLLAIALVIKLTSRGPILFRQRRTGRTFRRFTMYKFRTMREGVDRSHLKNEMSGPLFKMDHDPRCTPFGRFLRKTSLDELPQLWNVLRGDMTLIGPRALSPLPDQYEPWQLRRFDVTPGIACRWQAFDREKSDFDAWMRSDLRYVDEGESFWRDAKVLARTVLRVISCAGSR